jgi:hypothetical protein
LDYYVLEVVYLPKANFNLLIKYLLLYLIIYKNSKFFYLELKSPKSTCLYKNQDFIAKLLTKRIQGPMLAQKNMKKVMQNKFTKTYTNTRIVKVYSVKLRVFQDKKNYCIRRHVTKNK